MLAAGQEWEIAMSFRMNKEIVILDGARTPVGAFGGALRKVTATALGAHAGRAAIERAGVRPADIDNVVLRQRPPDQRGRGLSGPPCRPAMRHPARDPGADRQPALRQRSPGDRHRGAGHLAGRVGVRAGRRRREHEPGAARALRRALGPGTRAGTPRCRTRSGRRWSTATAA